MHFLIWETLSFNLVYVAACYLVGTGMCHNMVGLLQHYKRSEGGSFFKLFYWYNLNMIPPPCWKVKVNGDHPTNNMEIHMTPYFLAPPPPHDT